VRAPSAPESVERTSWSVSTLQEQIIIAEWFGGRLLAMRWLAKPAGAGPFGLGPLNLAAGVIPESGQRRPHSFFIPRFPKSFPRGIVGDGTRPSPTPFFHFILD
jgi:hypothetical protein